jgi:hypothetical protein
MGVPMGAVMIVSPRPTLMFEAAGREPEKDKEKPRAATIKTPLKILALDTPGVVRDIRIG